MTLNLNLYRILLLPPLILPSHLSQHTFRRITNTHLLSNRFRKTKATMNMTTTPTSLLSLLSSSLISSPHSRNERSLICSAGLPVPKHKITITLIVNNKVMTDRLEALKTRLLTMDTMSPLRSSGSGLDPSSHRSLALLPLRNTQRMARVPTPRIPPTTTVMSLTLGLSLTLDMVELVTHTSRVQELLSILLSTYPPSKVWTLKGFLRPCGTKLRHFYDYLLEADEGQRWDSQPVRPRPQVRVA